MAEAKEDYSTLKAVIAKYLMKHYLNIEPSYLDDCCNQLLSQGQINIHSGCWQMGTLRWSCCFKHSKYNRNLCRAAIQEPINPNPISIYCCKPQSLILSKILPAVAEKNAIKNDISLVLNISGAYFLFNDSNGLLYKNVNNLQCNEAALLHDIIHNKVPKDYYIMTTTKQCITITIDIPYTITTKKHYDWHFPLVEDQKSKQNSLFFKLSQYDKLFQQAKKIYRQNETLKLKLECQDKQIKQLESTVELQKNQLYQLNEGANNGNDDDNETQIEQQIFKFSE